jgi:predicted nucleotidyltransferase
MPIQQTIETRRGDILRIAALHGAHNVRVFGSMARGDAGPDSDVDLLVDVGENPTPFFPGGLLADLEDLLGRRVHVVTEQSLHWYIREQVKEEAVPL